MQPISFSLSSAFLVAIIGNLMFYTESKSNFTDLLINQQQELIEAYSRSNVQLVHAKLDNLRKKWMARLKKQDIAQLHYRFPVKDIPKNPPPEGTQTIQAITEINKKANLSEFMYQSDIVLTVAQVEQISQDENVERVRRQAFHDIYYPSTIWDKTFYYFFAPSATNSVKTVFNAAARFWQDNTCIKFVEDRIAPNRVRVLKGEGCYSYVGRVGGVQDLSLGKGCESVGTAAHELGHALGFFHTQSRVDRDNSISVLVANIQPEFIDQFGKETAATNYNYGIPYDYGSIMHYGATSASRNGRNTMVAKQENYQETMGSDIVAFYDVSMMNEHYNCKVQCPKSSSANCQNGGYPNPNNCAVCNCPSGYGGPLCNERPPGCGGILRAAPSFNSMTSVVGDGTRQSKLDFTKCNYWIQAPAGKRVQVRLENYQGYTADGCIYGGVEVKAHPDQLRTGYRFCSSADNGITLTAASNLLPIIVFNRYGTSRISLSYRYVDDQTATDGRQIWPAVVQTTTRVFTSKPAVPCRNYFYNCAILAFFGYCNNDNIRQKCRSACNLC